jgi:Fungal N-terminal domain of STAND proteins
MDPLSVMASVVGLLTAAGTVSSILSTFASSMKDVPRLIDHVLSEVKEVEIFLSAIQKFLLGIASAPRRRIALIQLDQLIVTLTEAVLTFSELEALVTPLAAKSKTSSMERLKWAWKEDAVSNIMQRLQRHKSSLSLMLNIVQWFDSLSNGTISAEL